MVSNLHVYLLHDIYSLIPKQARFYFLITQFRISITTTKQQQTRILLYRLSSPIKIECEEKEGRLTPQVAMIGENLHPGCYP
jgi:hypothetical protein